MSLVLSVQAFPSPLKNEISKKVLGHRGQHFKRSHLQSMTSMTKTMTNLVRMAGREEITYLATIMVQLHIVCCSVYIYYARHKGIFAHGKIQTRNSALLFM